MLAVHNLADQSCTVELDLGDEGPAHLLDIVADRVYEESSGNTDRLELEPYGYRRLRLDGGDRYAPKSAAPPA